MKIVVLTCDKYDWLMPGFAYLFNKNYGNVPVTVVCFRPLTLPPNFTIDVLPPEKDRFWTDIMQEYFEQMKDEYFLLLLDDYWLREPVNMENVKLLEDAIKDGADKAELTNTILHANGQPWKDKYVVAGQLARYRCSTQPSIWTRKYFLSHLIPHQNIWEFEHLGSRQAGNDGATLVALNIESRVFEFSNIMKKGNIAPKPPLKSFSKEDQEGLRKLDYEKIFQGRL